MSPGSETTTFCDLGADRLVPRHDGVGPGRHAVEPVAAVVVGDREVMVREDEDECTHVRVDVAEDPDDAGVIEPDRLRAAGGVAPEVERGRLRVREHVVVGLIVVGEVDRRAGHDREDVRHERLVRLVHPRALDPFVERRARRVLEGDDAAATIGRAVRRGHAEVGDVRAGLEIGRWRPQLDAAANGGCGGAGPERAVADPGRPPPAGARRRGGGATHQGRRAHEVVARILVRRDAAGRPVRPARTLPASRRLGCTMARPTRLRWK